MVSSDADKVAALRETIRHALRRESPAGAETQAIRGPVTPYLAADADRWHASYHPGRA